MQPPYYPGDPSAMMGPPGHGMPPAGPDPYAMPQQQQTGGYSDPAYSEHVGYGGVEGGPGSWGDGYYGGRGGETTSASGGAGIGQAGDHHHGEQSSTGYNGGWGGPPMGISTNGWVVFYFATPKVVMFLNNSGWPRKGGGSKQEVREGDWFCNTCGDHQFARNEYCRSCFAPKGAPPPDPSSPEYLAAVAAAYWPMMGAAYGSEGAADPSGAMSGAYGSWQGWYPTGKGKQGRRDGDWDCPACGDMNFASRVVCRKCGAAPSYGSGMGAYGAGNMSQGIPPNMAATGASTASAGASRGSRPRSRSRSRDRRF
ncbi:hypothetical protein FOL47_003242 [Perkinsus chesapeaki]|uniref:RanBP2-type domain-containing protein n=1 Tax=Perkinsus chesapeaki TaxID=330153 RepID=A0A7J6N420_PERCH|nr:hypothetical protein FOL47_003242 [Perkinsus chesapeaki]